ncbi:histidine phosphatase family protein [Kocuria marina]|uniref:histidine phosphatase family protein n=1 Tax=Kocuria marina TaxID=223184 RepID=UPI0038CD2889
MAATLERLRDAHAGGTVACFSHADPIRVAVSDALGTPLDRFQRLSVSPCSVPATRRSGRRREAAVGTGVGPDMGGEPPR